MAMTMMREPARAPAWREAGSHRRLFDGTSPIRDCEAHFPEPWTISPTT